MEEKQLLNKFCFQSNNRINTHIHRDNETYVNIESYFVYIFVVASVAILSEDKNRSFQIKIIVIWVH